MKEKKLIRAFIAIDIPREVINEVVRVQEELRKKNMFRGKFVDSENLHLTLKFLGEIEEEKVEEVKKRLREVKLEKFEAFLGEMGVFSSNYIRIVWLHVLGKKISELQKEIDEKLKDIFPKEERFMSHLTVARVKDVKDKKIFLEEMKKIRTFNLKFEVDRFVLFKSELPGKDKGFVIDSPVYSVLEEFELIEK